MTTSYASLPRLLDQLALNRVGLVVSHASLLRRYGAQLVAPLRRAGWIIHTITVPESERSKSFAMAGRVIDQVARRASMRAPVLFAFGGGVVGDLTGFVASAYRRGVPYVQLPTTLLGQVDSAIGGKTGVDLPTGKNLVGAFYQPRLVVNHLGLLASLPIRQRRSGLSEIVKYGVMGDAALFAYLERHAAACLRGSLLVDRVMVERCCRIKARVVSRDERETTGLRAQLNFGHTLGHALEAAAGYARYTHGEAIAIGMACASDMAVELGLLRPRDRDRITGLLGRLGLPLVARRVSRRAVTAALRRDKKFIHGKPRWVLPTRIGRVIVTEEIPPALMWTVIRRYVR